MFLMSCYEQTMLRMTILTLTEEEEGLQAFNPLQFRVPCMCLGFLKEVYHLRNFTEPRRGQYTQWRRHIKARVGPGPPWNWAKKF